jgi:hypothetical protein
VRAARRRRPLESATSVCRRYFFAKKAASFSTRRPPYPYFPLPQNNIDIIDINIFFAPIIAPLDVRNNMRASIVAIALGYTLGLPLDARAAFAFVNPAAVASRGINNVVVFRSTRTVLNLVELKPEPEGGEEVQRVSSSSSSLLPNSKLKNMGIDGDEGGDVVYKFWLSANADGKAIRKLRDQTEREASKKANFPGFRKVRSFCFFRYVSLSLPSLDGRIHTVVVVVGVMNFHPPFHLHGPMISSTSSHPLFFRIC